MNVEGLSDRIITAIEEWDLFKTTPHPAVVESALRGGEVVSRAEFDEVRDELDRIEDEIGRDLDAEMLGGAK